MKLRIDLKKKQTKYIKNNENICDDKSVIVLEAIHQRVKT